MDILAPVHTVFLLVKKAVKWDRVPFSRKAPGRMKVRPLVIRDDSPGNGLEPCTAGGKEQARLDNKFYIIPI